MCIQTKICTKCNVEKCLSEYYFFKSTNRYSTKCKSCQKIQNDLRVHKHFYFCKIHGEVWQSKQTKHCKECYQNNVLKYIVQKIKKSNPNFIGFIDLEKTTSHNLKVKAECKIHGIYTNTMQIIQQYKGAGCKKCANLIRSKNITKYNLDKRVCLKCKIEKSSNNFCVRSRNGKKYLYQYCKECEKINNKLRYSKVDKNIYAFNKLLYKRKINIFYNNCEVCSNLFIYTKKQKDNRFCNNCKISRNNYNNKFNNIYFFNCDKCKNLSIGNKYFRNNLCINCKNHYTGDHKKRCLIFGTNYQKFDKWELVFKRDNYICQYCGIICDTNKKNTNIKKYITIDCVIPISKGGSYEPNNCVTACRSCNSKKRDNLNILPNKFPYKSKQLPLF